MGKIARYLNQLIIGNIYDAPEILEAYSTDRSALKIKPKFVAFPESTEDVRKLLKFCYQLAGKNINIPVAFRGSGLDEAGADLCNGLVISTEKLNRLLESDRRERLVRVQAGITLKELNTALSVNGLTIPIGGHEMETIGGLISSCPRDNYSAKQGGIMNFVERIEVVLANGDILQTSRLGASSVKRKGGEKTLEGEIYRKFAKIAKSDGALLKDLQKNTKNLAGYPTIARAIRKGSVDLMPLFFGAEGTLGMISEVILRAVPIRKQPRRVVATFEDFGMAQKFLSVANELKPLELNIYDINIIKTAEETGKKLGDITKSLESGFVVFAKYDEHAKSRLRKISGLRKILPRSSRLIVESKKTEASLNEFENSLVSFLNYAKNGERVPLVTDFYIPPQNLENFVRDLKVLEKSLKLELALFGSYSASNYSLRPKFNIEDDNYVKFAVTFLRAGNFVIERQNGFITGGTPEGRIKALVAKTPEAETNLYTSVKQAFDKRGILNPGVKIDHNARFTATHFRTTSSVKIMI